MILKIIERSLNVDWIVSAAIKTWIYRKKGYLAASGRIVGGGKILHPRSDSMSMSVGMNSIIRGELFVFPHAGKIEIGEWCFVGEDSYVWSSNHIKIGDRVLISHNVNIHDTDGHPFDASARHEQYRSIATVGHPSDIDSINSRPITIMDDVWIGFGASVLKGITVGEGAIVAAGAVVTKDVPPYSVVVGNPARVVRSVAEPQE